LRWEYLHGLRKNIHDDLLDHLWHWLMDHIVEADKRFSHFIAGLGSCTDDADALAPAAT
jgi:hemerythrin